MTTTDDPIEVLWTPSPERVANTRMTHYQSWLREERNVHTDNYQQLWRWSVSEPATFWESIWSYFGVIASTQPTESLGDATMPGAIWFPEARLNWAENILRHARTDDAAVVALNETGAARTTSWRALEQQVANVATAFRQMGVKPGDRVAAVLPNITATVVAVLATASVGAVWSCCAPDFGLKGLTDRLSQIQPTVLIGVDGYQFNGKWIDRRATIEALSAQLPTVRHTVIVYNGHWPNRHLPNALDFGDLSAGHATPSYEQVSFDHPLWILYSSGTSGLPKGIVHSHGGILLESLKSNALHYDLGSDDRVFIAASTAWVVWNMLVDAMTTGATIITYDGSSTYGRPDHHFQICADHRVTRFGTGAAYLTLCEKAGSSPVRDFDLSALRSIMSTGSPLPDTTWHWVYEHVSPDVHLGSDSGGTDVATAFIGANPLSPVVTGELQGPYLGVAVEAWDDFGHSVIDQLGEMVITAPMPSMPVYFWNDDSQRTRYHNAYFAEYPGVWRHGDWITRTARGTFRVHGRSDSTLNRGGVRMGSADVYQAIETLPEIAESLIIGAELPGGGYHMPLFVVLKPGHILTDGLIEKICTTIRHDVSPRHVPDEIIDVPAIPTTRTGKRLEIPVKKLIQGAPPEAAINPATVADTATLDWFIDYARRFRESHRTS
ncbi:acetoacetate--CoA ligase [Nocardia fusca]|uniref:acetoacetate--CoA ligase n=1 Tax=Nocardia fusca TaxID=941183 RepID=UPI0037CA94D8